MTTQYAYGDIEFRVGDIVSSLSGTFFLIDNIQGKLIARGFGEAATYDAVCGREGIQSVPDQALAVLDGYELIQSGSCLVKAYGSSAIYFLDGDRLRRITNAAAFAQYQFSASTIQTLPPSAFGQLLNDPSYYIGTSDRSVAWNDVVFTVGGIYASPAGTFFLVDEQNGKLIARGFTEGATYDTVCGVENPPVVPDEAFGVLDGYQSIESGSCLVRGADSVTVWFLDGNRLRGITSSEAMDQHSFNRNAVHVWPPGAFAGLRLDSERAISTSDEVRTWIDPAPKRNAEFAITSKFSHSGTLSSGQSVDYYTIDSRFRVDGVIESITYSLEGVIPAPAVRLKIGDRSLSLPYAENEVLNDVRGQRGRRIEVKADAYWVLTAGGIPVSGRLMVRYWADTD
jgi:hypothetical protein